MTNANLGFSVNTGNLPGAITDLDKLAASAAKAETAVKGMSQGVSQGASGMAAGLSSVTTGMRNTATEVENLASRIERALNVQGGAMVGSAFAHDPRRAADLVAYGNEMDRLRAKFNPLFAAEQQHRTMLAEIASAHRVGAISANEMSAAVDRETAAFRRLSEAQRMAQGGGMGRGGANDNGSLAGTNQGMQRMMSANLMYQFQDIAVTTAMGMSPAMIALQQGTQIGAALSATGGGAAGVKALGSAFAGLVSPVNLATIALVGAGAAMIQFFTSGAEESKKAEEALARHKKLVEELGDTYSSVAAIAKEGFLSDSGDLAFGIERSANELRMLLAQAASAASPVNSLWGGFGNPQGLGIMAEFDPRTSTTTLSVREEFSLFEQEILDLYATIQAGTPDFLTFRDALTDRWNLEPNNEQLTEQALALLKVTEEAARLETEYRRLGRAQEEFNRNVDPRTGLLRPSGNWAAEDRESLNNFEREQAVVALRTQRTLEAEIQQLNARTLEQRVAAVRAIEEANRNNNETAQERRTRIENAALMERLRIERDMADAARSRAIALEDVMNEQRLEQALVGKSIALQEEARMAYRLKLELHREADELGVEVSAEELANIEKQAAAYGRLAEQMQLTEERRDRARALERKMQDQQLELELIGRTIAETEALRMEYQLTQELREAAYENGVAMDQKELEMIRLRAQEYGRLAEQIARVNMMRDLQFERDQLFRSSTDQSIASRLRGAGLPVDLNGAEASFMRETMRLQEIRDGIGGFFDDFREGLLQGDDFGEALGNAILNGLNNALDKVAEDAFNALAGFLTQALFGTGSSAGGAAGGAGGVIGAILGGGGSGGAASTFAAPVGEVIRMALPAIGQTVTSSVSGTMEMYRQAISGIESGSFGGNYSALGPWTGGDRAYGRYQVMGNNIPSWSRQALGRSITPEQFLANPSYQDAIFDDQFGRNIAKYGNPQDAASVWFTGRPQSAGAGARDVLGTSGSGYVEKFNRNLEKLGATTQQTASVMDVANDNVAGLAQSAFASGKGLELFGGTMAQLGSALQSIGGGAGGGGWFSGLMSMFGGVGGATNFMMGISPLATAHIAGGFGGLFSKGGITDRPSIFGEAGPEAAVPLPDGRSIPVTLRGGANNNTPGEIRIVVVGEEGPMFRPAIRAESETMSVKVVKEYDSQIRNVRQNGGNDR